MKEKIKLSGAPETMLQTVYARAKESRGRGTIHDAKAEEITRKLDYDFSLADNLFKFDQRFYAFVDRRDARLHVFAVGGDGVEKISGETAGDLVQPGQDGAVVLGAEHHAVHLVRGEVVAGDQMGIAGVAHQHIPLFKAAQQPVGVILHGVGAPAGLDDRGPRPLSPSLYARGRIFAKRRYN